MKNKNKICGNCIYENACQMWVPGNISVADATSCSLYTETRDSTPYYIGAKEERERIFMEELDVVDPDILKASKGY